MFTAISRSVSTGIQRNLTISEAKHEAKLDDLKRELARAKLLRAQDHGRKLAEARNAHVAWLSSLTPDQVAVYQQSMADIEAIVNPAPTST